jgi:hypothetical protein
MNKIRPAVQALTRCTSIDRQTERRDSKNHIFLYKEASNVQIRQSLEIFFSWPQYVLISTAYMGSKNKKFKPNNKENK